MYLENLENLYGQSNSGLSPLTSIKDFTMCDPEHPRVQLTKTKENEFFRHNLTSRKLMWSEHMKEWNLHLLWVSICQQVFLFLLSIVLFEFYLTA